MKKIISLILGIILVFVCVGCSTTDTNYTPKIEAAVSAVAEHLELGTGEMVLYQMIEAKDGSQYQDGKVEIYQYTDKDEVYKKFKANEYVLTADACNNGFVLIITEDIENKQALIDKFNAIQFK